MSALCGRLAAVLAIVVVSPALAAGPRLLGLAKNAEIIPCYQPIEVAFQLSREYDNPFDPRVIRVDATVITPTGVTRLVAGYYTQEFARELVDGVVMLNPVGEPRWQVRFTPRDPGGHRLVIRVRDAEGTTESAELRFAAVPSNAPGYLLTDGRGFRFTNGTAFYPVGSRVLVPDGGDPAPALKMLAEMPLTKRNTARLVLSPATLGLEWSEGIKPYGHWAWYRGAGQVNLAAAWALDQILAAAETHGVKLVVCLLDPTTLASNAWDTGWPGHPHRVGATGSGLSWGYQWLTEAVPQASFETLLRYLAARYAHSPAILCWDLADGLDAAVDRYDWPVQPVTGWLERMADSLHQLDGYGHPVGFTSASPAAWHPEEDGFWLLQRAAGLQVGLQRLPQGRSPDYFEPEVSWLKRNRDVLYTVADRPWLVSGWALDDLGVWDRQDTAGTGWHNALWAGLFSFHGGGLVAEASEALESNRSWTHAAGLAAYLAGEDWGGAADQFLRAEGAQVTTFGLAAGQRLYVWVHDQASLFHKPEPELVSGCRLLFPPEITGRWLVEEWDTRGGRMVSRQEVAATATGLVVDLQPFRRDVALKLRRAGDLAQVSPTPN